MTEQGFKIVTFKNNPLRGLTEVEVMERIKQEPSLICYVTKQTEKMCELAVSIDGMCLRYVNRQNNNICEIAVTENGLAIKYVLKQTPLIRKLALKENSNAIHYVKNLDAEEYKLIQRQKNYTKEEPLLYR